MIINILENPLCNDLFNIFGYMAFSIFVDVTIVYFFDDMSWFILILIPVMFLSVFALGFVDGIWLFITLAKQTLTYMLFCNKLNRQKVNLILKSFIFIALSLLFVIWITVLFGANYYQTNAEIKDLYQDEIFSIIDWNMIPPIKDFFLSCIFFNIAMEKYFILPEYLSITNVHFIQFVIGIVIAGTILSGIYSIVKKLIVPTNGSNDEGA